MVEYKISRFGLATVQSGVSPDEAIMLYEDLNRALGGLNLQTDLHLLYLVTPQDRGLYPDFQVRHTPIIHPYMLPHNIQYRILCGIVQSLSAVGSSLRVGTLQVQSEVVKVCLTLRCHHEIVHMQNDRDLLATRSDLIGKKTMRSLIIEVSIDPIETTMSF